MELSPDCARLLRLRIKMMNFVIICFLTDNIKGLLELIQVPLSIKMK